MLVGVIHMGFILLWLGLLSFLLVGVAESACLNLPCCGASPFLSFSCLEGCYHHIQDTV